MWTSRPTLYLYTAGGTGLEPTIPSWAFEGGREALLKRLADPETRVRLKREIATSHRPGGASCEVLSIFLNDGSSIIPPAFFRSLYHRNETVHSPHSSSSKASASFKSDVSKPSVNQP